MRISLRIKLALVSLLLLLFPLLGMRLNTIIKNNLITSQEDTLSFTAQAVAAALASQADLFSREQFHALNRNNDLYLFQLFNAIRLDGQLADWHPEYDQAQFFGNQSSGDSEENSEPRNLGFRHLAGKQGKHLYAFFEVQDDHLVFRNRQSLRLDRSDHLQILIEGDGWRRRYLVSPHEPGWVNGFRMPDNPIKFPVIESGIQGVWRRTERGYVLEIRMPLALLGKRLSFTIVDVDDPEKRQITAQLGTAAAGSEEPGWLLGTSKAIEAILQSLDRPYARIRVVDGNQRVRAQVGSLRAYRERDISRGGMTALMMERVHRLLQPLYRFFTTSFSADITDQVSQPTALDLKGIAEALAGNSSLTRYRMEDDKVEVMAAITPLRDGKEVVGAVVVEQTTNSILALSNRLIEETLSLSLLAFVLGGGVLLVFAFRISARIRRLRNQAAASLTDDGRVRNIIPTGKAGDEIGDLGNTLHSMLEQLKLQVEHREKMADNLEHEMRTPLAGVAASLKNLAEELGETSVEIQQYLAWAGRDVLRLEELLTSIREATTLQESLQLEAQEVFDLGRAVSLWLEHGWQQTCPEIAFVYEPPRQSVAVKGDPLRLRQAMDKLVENAVSFHAPGTAITLCLQLSGTTVSLQVINLGSSIDPSLQRQIFNSMVSSRPEKDDLPHLGLGLYIVRTITQYHGGTVRVDNLQDGQHGVVFTMILPVVES